MTVITTSPRRCRSGPRLLPGELGDGQRHQQQRRGEDRRDHARRVDLQRQVRALLLDLAARGLALGILDEHPALGALHEADEQDQDQRHADDQPMITKRIEAAGAAAFEHLRERGRQLGDDAGHDDQRDAVADAAAGDLLAEPHQEHGAADQADHGGDAEQHAGIDHRRLALRRAPAFEADGHEIALDRAQEDGAVAGILVDLLAAALALFLERAERAATSSSRAA